MGDRTPAEISAHAFQDQRSQTATRRDIGDDPIDGRATAAFVRYDRRREIIPQLDYRGPVPPHPAVTLASISPMLGVENRRASIPLNKVLLTNNSALA